jgi:glycerol-1-phosphate dehydrogenase [NAD(P)+]
LRQLVEKREFAPALDLRESRLGAAKALLAGSPYYDKTIDMIVGKTPSATALASRGQGARKSWETIAARYAEQIPPFETLKADLRAGGCPTEPMEIGLSREACVKSLKIASLIRNRYTILDLVSELGILDEAAEAIFAEPWFSMYEA